MVDALYECFCLSSLNKQIIYCKMPLFVRYLNQQDRLLRYKLAVTKVIYILHIHVMFCVEKGKFAKLCCVYHKCKITDCESTNGIFSNIM